MLEIICRPNQSLEQAIKEFKRIVRRSGLMYELERASFYQKPSRKRKEKRKRAEIQRRNDARKEREQPNKDISRFMDR